MAVLLAAITPLGLYTPAGPVLAVGVLRLAAVGVTKMRVMAPAELE